MKSTDTELKVIYQKEREGSYSLWKRAQRAMAGGVSHNIRMVDPFPFFVKSARGAWLKDVDGNRYLDFWMGHYAHILGHRPPFVANALANALTQRGYHFGLLNREEVELAELICHLVPCAEMVRFCTSGTEATMYAVRLARAATGRSVILKAKGGWHGANSDLCFGIHPPFEGPDSKGLFPKAEEWVRLFPFNDTETTKEILKDTGDDLAGVILEPVMGVGGFVSADPAFIQMLRKETEKIGALLIFDEVISGFRVGLGGAQEMLEVTPDLVTLGKVIGGGFPAGAIAGKREILELARPGGPVLIGGGTFSCNPLSMLAGLLTLRFLESNAKWLYPHLKERGELLRKKVEETGEAFGVPLRCTGTGSLFMTHLMREECLEKELRSPQDIEDSTHSQWRDKELRLAMLVNGVHLLHGGGAISLAHGEKEMAFFTEALERALRVLKEGKPQ